ncbi:MAG: LysM peptidoglycan-binding domain-containing protein [Pararhizobium sp.]
MTRSQIGSFAVGVLGVALAIVVVGAVVRHGTAPDPAVRTANAPAVEKPAPDSGPAGKAEAPAPKAASASASDEPASADKQAGAQQKPTPEGSDRIAKAAPAPAAADTSAPAKAPAAEAKPRVPSFDVLRVEPDGSTVIAGRAPPNADVAIMNGEKRLATTRSDENGDFVAVLDPPLAPGDYELSLKATGKDRKAVSSIETATVSVPEDKKGDLLAMVTKPGAASRIVAAPKPQAPAPEAKAPVDPASAVTPPAPAEAALDASPPEPAKAARVETQAAPAGDRPAADDATAGDHVRVDAVEIEGNSLYVAGSATTGRKVRVYADGRFAGEDPSARKGRFVVESSTDLKPGAHTIRADLVDPRTGDVVVRATVPFTRPEGDQFAAVAPSSSGKDQAPGGGQAFPAAPSADASPADQASPDASGGPKTVMQPALTNSDDFVIIRRGDTLWQIARRVYGRGVRYTTIYLANTSQITDPDLILPGQIFDVPAKSLPDAEKVHRRLRDGGKASG